MPYIWEKSGGYPTEEVTPPKDPLRLKNPKGSVTTVPFTGVFLKANPFLGKANPFLGKANLDSGPS